MIQMSPNLVAISYSEITIGDRDIASIFSVLNLTLKTRIVVVEPRHHLAQLMQFALLIRDLRAILVTQRRQ